MLLVKDKLYMQDAWAVNAFANGTMSKHIKVQLQAGSPCILVAERTQLMLKWKQQP
jgi:hypothetical protein